MGVFDSIRGRDDNARLTKTVVNTDDLQTAQPATQTVNVDTENPEKHHMQVESKDTHPDTVPVDNDEKKHLGEATSDSDTSFGVNGVDDDAKEIERNPEHVTKQAGLGQQKVEAAALVWSRPAVYALYAWIWVCFFMLALHSAIGSNLINYVYSDFSQAPQISTSYILASIIGGVLKLPVGKTLQLWGRAEALLVSICIYILGMIILAACNGANAFAAGYVLYWIGYYCIYLILDVFVADTSGLRSRAFAFAFASTPFICTAFTGSLAATSIRLSSGWRWGYGMFCIIQPAVFLPLVIVFKFYEKKAIGQGVWTRTPSGRTTIQSIIHYIHEFDVIGALLLMIAWVLFLLPFSLAQYGRSQYKDASFIALVVIGFSMLFVFAAWEKWFARTHFVRYDLLKKPTILGACICSAVVYFSFYLWDQYYYNFVLITYDLNSTMAGYMAQIYNVGSCFWSPVLGVIIYFTHRFKYICLCFGVPLMILGSGLMIHFRGSDYGIGYIVMCQIFIAFGGGTLVIGEDMAVMAAGGREGTPIMLALIGLFSSIGGGIGYAVSAAIYNNAFVDALTSHLPDDLKANATQIYTDGISVQELYPVGSELRDATVYAWGYAQRMNCIASTCLLILLIPAVAVWKNYDVSKKQNKGTMAFE
ncbi:Siderochrome iron transporter 2 [Penicillium taxi]|uniref:Siderochrome iron transporter 2 n=1 Tax=Penicillium taxi TaxID=168475 RepID=UPI0025455D19|nr:Siderochrome iron transporter 2 [Penicillium taxi]KAJ5902239.1 Siderochrome iron transporter 2 [Penicillium taxi]